MLDTTANRTAISATRIAENQRLSALPKFFGNHMLRAERLVYTWLAKLSTDYTGGCWDFYELSNGGFYMAPDDGAIYSLTVDSNGYSGNVSADAAGIVACLFAMCQLANTSTDARIVELYHDLRDFAHTHSEAKEIFAAID